MTNDVQIDIVSGVVTQSVAVVAAPVTVANDMLTVTGLTLDVLTARQLVEMGDLVTFSFTPSATEGEKGKWCIESVTGNIGHVHGNVGDVTGNVGDVTGDVGDVGGDVADVDGDVRSVGGNVDGNVGGSVGSVDGDVGDVGGDVGDISGSCGEVSGDVGGGGGVDREFWDELRSCVDTIKGLIRDNCNN